MSDPVKDAPATPQTNTEEKPGESKNAGGGDPAGGAAGGQISDNKEAIKEGEAAKPPAEYTAFKLPEKTPVASGQIEGIKEFAKKNNLNQEQAQQVVDLQVKHAQEFIDAQISAFENLKTEWLETVKADAEIGGSKYEESQALVDATLNKFADAEFVKWANETGARNFPGFVRTFIKIGKQIKEDTTVLGGKEPKPTPLYPNSNMVVG
jgi:hypothetical protein